ncbi:H-X9-DG-CTERM domain-containing protein [Haliscomenobacter hydrossis]
MNRSYPPRHSGGANVAWFDVF